MPVETKPNQGQARESLRVTNTIVPSLRRTPLESLTTPLTVSSNPDSTPDTQASWPIVHLGETHTLLTIRNQTGAPGTPGSTPPGGSGAEGHGNRPGNSGRDGGKSDGGGSESSDSPEEGEGEGNNVRKITLTQLRTEVGKRGEEVAQGIRFVVTASGAAVMTAVAPDPSLGPSTRIGTNDLLLNAKEITERVVEQGQTITVANWSRQLGTPELFTLQKIDRDAMYLRTYGTTQKIGAREVNQNGSTLSYRVNTVGTVIIEHKNEPVNIATNISAAQEREIFGGKYIAARTLVSQIGTMAKEPRAQDLVVVLDSQPVLTVHTFPNYTQEELDSVGSVSSSKFASNLREIAGQLSEGQNLFVTYNDEVIMSVKGLPEEEVAARYAEVFGPDVEFIPAGDQAAKSLAGKDHPVVVTNNGIPDYRVDHVPEGQNQRMYESLFDDGPDTPPPPDPNTPKPDAGPKDPPPGPAGPAADPDAPSDGSQTPGGSEGGPQSSQPTNPEIQNLANPEAAYHEEARTAQTNQIPDDEQTTSQPPHDMVDPVFGPPLQEGKDEGIPLDFISSAEEDAAVAPTTDERLQDTSDDRPADTSEAKQPASAEETTLFPDSSSATYHHQAPKITPAPSASLDQPQAAGNMLEASSWKDFDRIKALALEQGQRHFVGPDGLVRKIDSDGTVSVEKNNAPPGIAAFHDKTADHDQPDPKPTNDAPAAKETEHNDSFSFRDVPKQSTTSDTTRDTVDAAAKSYDDPVTSPETHPDAADTAVENELALEPAASSPYE